MATRVSSRFSVNLSIYRKLTGSHLPVNEISEMQGLHIHRNVPVRRSLENELLDGNFTQEDRFSLNVMGVGPQELANSVYLEEDLSLDGMRLIPGKMNDISPGLKAGSYNYESKDFQLYPRNSTYEIVTESPWELEKEPSKDPISVAIYMRTAHGILPYLEARQVEEFTGKLEEEGRGEDESEFLNEYIYDPDNISIELNRNIEKLKTTPDEPTSGREIIHYGDTVGYGNNESCQVFRTKYLPLDPDSVRVFVITKEDDNLDNVEEWEIVDNFLNSSSTDKHVVVDYDLGILRFGGKRGQDGTLIAESVIGGYGLALEDTSSFPWYGTIEVSDEEEEPTWTTLSYIGKTNHVLLLTEALADEFPSGAQVRIKETGAKPPAFARVVVMYRAVPRLEYVGLEEPELLVERRGTSPLYFMNGEALLGVDRKETVPFKITLTPKNIGRNRRGDGSYEWGPVYFRETVVLVEGLVTDIYGTPVEGIAVNVEGMDGGSIDGTSVGTYVTDSNGKFYFEFYPDTASMFNPIYALSVTHDDGESLLEFNHPLGSSIPMDSDRSLLHVYAVLKDDGTQGSVGRKIVFDTAGRVGTNLEEVVGFSFQGTSLSADVYPNSEDAILLFDAIEIDDLREYEGGQARVYYDSGTESGSVLVGITKVRPIHEFSIIPDSASYRQIKKTCILNIDTNLATHECGGKNLTKIHIWTATEVMYDPTKLNGRKAVLRIARNATPENPGDIGGYTPWEPSDLPSDDGSSETWVHPSSADYSLVYKPVTPIRLEGNFTAVFNGELPLPDRFDDDKVLAAYALFVPRACRIRAYIESEECPGVHITSAQIRFLVQYSPSDIGTIKSEEGYVPWGYRLPSPSLGFDGASGIDVPTYLTLNDLHRLSETFYDTESPGSAVPLITYLSDGHIMYSDMADTALVNSTGLEVIEE